MPRRQQVAVPAPIGDRIVARFLDFVFTGACFLTAFVIVFRVDGEMPLFASQEWEFESAIWAGIAAALASEFLMLGRKRKKTFGKWVMKMTVAVAGTPDSEAGSWRSIARLLATVVMCGVVFLFSVDAAGESVSRLSEDALLTHLTVAVAGTWLSAVVSALLNRDRRGWHDLLAGTMLVSASSTPECSPDDGAPPDEPGHGEVGS